MTKDEYRRYLRSTHWLLTRARILARAGERCEWCQRFCGREPHAPDVRCADESCDWCRAYFDEDGQALDVERQTLEVHHKTYERVGAERDEDLVALCWSCHDEVTDRTKELQRLARAGRVSRSEATPAVAGTNFWRTLWRGLFGRR